MEEYINSNNRDVKRFKLKYTKNELKCIDRFIISKKNKYIYTGCQQNMSSLFNFLSDLGNNRSECIKIIEKFVTKLLNKILLVFKTKYYRLEIRATLPNNIFDIPRWHKDNRDFGESITKVPSFVTVLKGPGTLLIKNTKKVSTIYNDTLKKINIECRKIDNKNLPFNKAFLELAKINIEHRLLLAKNLKTIKIIQIKNNEGVIFYPSALHSEPKIDTPRISIFILPVNETNVEMLKQRE